MIADIVIPSFWVGYVAGFLSGILILILVAMRFSSRGKP